MDSALKVYSWKGLFAEEIHATSVKSRGAARNLGPFVSHDRREIVTWIRSSWKGNRRKRRAHFRRLPKARLRTSRKTSISESIDDELTKRSSSTIHNECRDILASALQDKIGTKLEWAIKNPELSDYTFKGDLLRGVVAVETEYRISTPFGKDFVLDIALLGPVIGNKRIVLGGIELELHHEFEHLKCLICKCLGFPLVSIDITDFSDSDVIAEKLLNSLIESTVTSDDGRRRNFFYLHPCLLPIYLVAPHHVVSELKHQFVVFVDDNKFETLVKYLKRLRDCLECDPALFRIDPVRPKGSSGLSMIKNEGSIAGHDWKEYSQKQYLRISIPRHHFNHDSNYFFHLTFAQIVNAHVPSLVGYKFEPRVENSDPENPIWVKRKWIKQEIGPGAWDSHRICPKHLSDPIESILRAISTIGNVAIEENDVF